MKNYLLKVENVLKSLNHTFLDDLTQYQGSHGHSATSDVVFNGLQDLRCINHMAPDYYPDGLQNIFPIPIHSCIDSANKESVHCFYRFVTVVM
jgi:hypothetical protein